MGLEGIGAQKKLEGKICMYICNFIWVELERWDWALRIIALVKNLSGAKTLSSSFNKMLPVSCFPVALSLLCKLVATPKETSANKSRRISQLKHNDIVKI